MEIWSINGKIGGPHDSDGNDFSTDNGGPCSQNDKVQHTKKEEGFHSINFVKYFMKELGDKATL